MSPTLDTRDTALRRPALPQQPDPAVSEPSQKAEELATNTLGPLILEYPTSRRRAVSSAAGQQKASRGGSARLAVKLQPVHALGRAGEQFGLVCGRMVFANSL